MSEPPPFGKLGTVPSIQTCDDKRALLLLGVTAIALGAFALVARRVARDGISRIDDKVSEALAVEPDHHVRQVAKKAAPIGKWWTYVPAAVVTAGAIAALPPTGATSRRAHAAGALAIVVSGLSAARLNHLLDRLPQPPAPPGRPRPDHPVFPSGHAFGTASVALTAAYVVARESLAPATAAVPLALLLPVGSSIGRMIEEKHWFSDVVGGYLAALALSSSMLSLYESARTRAPERRIRSGGA